MIRTSLLLASGLLACAGANDSRRPDETARESVATASRAAGEPDASPLTRREAVATSSEMLALGGDMGRGGDSRVTPEERAAAVRGKTETSAAQEKAATASTAKGRYTLDGRVSEVGGTKDSVAIAREGGEPAKLRVEEGTRVVIDGKEASVSDLKEGDEVRATFDLREDKPVAVEVRAKREGSR